MANFNKGDRVKITQRGRAYTLYQGFADKYQVKGFSYSYNDHDNGDTGTVQLVGEHHCSGEIIVAVELDNGPTLLINEEGLKYSALPKVNKEMTLKQAKETWEQLKAESAALNLRIEEFTNQVESYGLFFND